jgi:hypothetical protein
MPCWVLKVNLTQKRSFCGVDEAEGVAAETVHVAVGRGRPRSLMTMVTWCSASGNSVQKSQLLLALRMLVRGIAFDGVVQVREFQRVAQEEHRRVVAHQVPVALLGVELDGEAADVALGIGRAALAGHGGEAHEHVGLLADFGEDFCLACIW